MGDQFNDGNVQYLDCNHASVLTVITLKNALIGRMGKGDLGPLVFLRSACESTLISK